MIPIKPEHVTFTDAQWRAIWEKGGDILVSAAAGSGKTRVLITRLIEKVLDETHPIDVDQLLVVTFTNAAAAEMRQRMADALDEAIADRPDDERLRDQLTLLNKAHISTLHSFCLHVVKQYAYLLDIDPGFAIADQMETALLREEVLDDVLERAYGDEERRDITYAVADSFTSDRDDGALEKLIEQLYDYAVVDPDPIGWLKTLPRLYEVEGIRSLDELPFVSILREEVTDVLLGAKSMLREAEKIARLPMGPAAYIDTVRSDEEMIDTLLIAVRDESWEEVHERFQTLSFVRAASVRKGDADETLKKRAQQKRNDAKKLVESFQKTLFHRAPERTLDDLQAMHPIIEQLVRLTIDFYEAYNRAKKERALVDFSDLEHYALAILAEEVDGKIEPSPIAKSYREQFEEVLVDEYQDTNILQETIIQLVKRHAPDVENLFMVGDVKQSIYRFRLAEPHLFLEKYKRYSDSLTKEAEVLKIDLNANYRRRKEIVDGTNDLFAQVMDEEVGEIVYDDEAALHYGARYPERDTPVHMTFVYEGDPIDQWPKEEMMPARIEARVIATQIEQLIENGAEVTDAFSGETRRATYKDFVVLLRSMTWSNAFSEEFKKAGIPLHVELSEGYFEAIEVKVIMSVLQTIDNPYQDIPLTATLRAPFFRFTDDELARVRGALRHGSFYEALQQYEQNDALTVETKRKVTYFLDALSTWRSLARHSSLNELLTAIFEETHYYDYVGALPNGKQRQANLRALQSRAVTYEQTSYRGLFRFLRFIDRMRERGDDLGVARYLTEQDDVVRMTTIHSSKGLEYPYVFLAGLARPFNKMDFRASYLFDQQYGLAVKAINPETRIVRTSLPYYAFQAKKERELIAEEMRILYVAMTRAKEHLYLLATLKDPESAVNGWVDAASESEGVLLPRYVRATATSYLDWIGPALVRHPQFEPFLPEEAFLESLPMESKWAFHWYDRVQFAPTEREKREEDARVEALDETYIDQIERRMNQLYAYEESTTVPSKQSVTGLKRMIDLERTESEEVVSFAPSIERSERTVEGERPRFMQETRRLTGAERGTAIHTIMEHIDFSKVYDAAAVATLLQQLVERQLLTEEERKAVDVLEIVSFFDSSVAHELRQSQRVYRELPFTYVYEPDEGIEQLLQGIIDCVYRSEAGELVILDYKTDYVSNEDGHEQLIDRYTFQLNTYRRALEQITKERVDRLLIYSFHLNEVVTLPKVEDVKE